MHTRSARCGRSTSLARPGTTACTGFDAGETLLPILTRGQADSADE
ncbi:hypothetical protein [Streptomyces goshikiensis]